MTGAAADVWRSVAGGGRPTLLEIAGLQDPEAPDIDRPLLQVVDDTLVPLLAGGFTVVEREYDETGAPGGTHEIKSAQPTGDPLIVILATRRAGGGRRPRAR